MDDELFQDLFPDELRTDQVQDMVAALERRLAAAESGDLPASPEERDEMRQHIKLLRQEVVIAEFVEENLAQALVRRQILEALDESEDG